MLNNHYQPTFYFFFLTGYVQGSSKYCFLLHKKISSISYVMLLEGSRRTGVTPLSAFTATDEDSKSDEQMQNVSS